MKTSDDIKNKQYIALSPPGDDLRWARRVRVSHAAPIDETEPEPISSPRCLSTFGTDVLGAITNWRKIRLGTCSGVVSGEGASPAPAASVAHLPKLRTEVTASGSLRKSRSAASPPLTRLHSTCNCASTSRKFCIARFVRHRICTDVNVASRRPLFLHSEP
jgi:hypothetical protein